MSIPVIGALMACAAAAIGTAIGWLLAACLQTLATRVKWPARSRATFIAQVRLLPLATALVLVTAQVHAFVRFEQSRAESVGPLLIALALAGAALGIEALGRGIGCVRATARLMVVLRRSAIRLPLATWHQFAWVVRQPYPVVAVVGTLRPELFIARQVITRCTREEMAAILAHERAHIASHDNLVQLLFALTPGARVLRRIALPLEVAWRVTTEEAADQSSGQVAGHLELASALIKLTRMSPPISSTAAASALIGESELDARVRRLIEAAGVTQQIKSAWLPLLLLATVALALQTSFIGTLVHEAFELLLRSH